MFNQLIASKPVRGGGRGYWGLGNVSVSVILHVVLLVGAAYASQNIGAQEEAPEEDVTFIDVVEPPPPPEPPPAQDMPPPPAGFQELIPPVEPPSFIPDISEALVPVDLAQYTGIGLPTTIATPAPVVEAAPEDDPGFAYAAEVLDVEPRLLNMSEVVRSIERLYPRLLLQAGIGGVTVLRFVVDTDGTVDTGSVVVIESTNEDFADASKQAVGTFRFQPGVFRGQNVRSLVQMPINWQPGN